MTRVNNSSGEDAFATLERRSREITDSQTAARLREDTLAMEGRPSDRPPVPPGTREPSEKDIKTAASIIGQIGKNSTPEERGRAQERIEQILDDEHSLGGVNTVRLTLHRLEKELKKQGLQTVCKVSELGDTFVTIATYPNGSSREPENCIGLFMHKLQNK
jgi:hypothetical protein